jgi:hypothetical protein
MARRARRRRMQQPCGITGGHDTTTVMARRVVTSVRRGRPGAVRPSRLPLTLADLITAIQDIVGPQDDGLVVATVGDLLQSGRLMRRGTGTCSCAP